MYSLNRSGATVLLVGLGGGRQEKFIFRYRDRLPHVSLYLPLGGTIDYEAEALRRPPPWITNAGLEWLYRMLRQPRQRWRRYLVHQPPFLYLFARQLLGIYNNPFADLYQRWLHGGCSPRKALRNTARALAADFDELSRVVMWGMFKSGNAYEPKLVGRSTKELQLTGRPSNR